MSRRLVLRGVVGVVVAVGALTVLPSTTYAATVDAEMVATRIGLTRGICVLLDDKECKLARQLAGSSELRIYVRLSDPADFEPAAREADAAGLYGTRIIVEKGSAGRIGLADDVADAVVAVGERGAVSRDEILRVLRPEGKAIVGSDELTKPIPQGIDEWSHHYHAPDNNPQSKDQLARAPFLTQFIVEPRYAPAPQAAVASGGRIFMAFGNVAWHQREEPAMNRLVALNGYNGTLLWTRPLTPGVMVDRSTMIATPETLYLADDKSCKLLDAATGKLRGEIVPPRDLTGGTFWKWMASDGGVLYALVGPDEPLDSDAKWRSQNHGWPWNGISRGYNDTEYRWGFAKTLLAIDPQSKQVLWSHQEDPPIDSRSLAMTNGRIYFCSFGKYLTCLDAKTGKPIWRRTAEKDPEVFEAIGPYRPGHGYVGGWKSTVYVKSTREALYVVGPQVEWLTALSTEDGRVLWKHPVKDLHVVIRDDGLYCIGPQNNNDATQKLDPRTGKVLASYATRRRACTRSTGSADGIFFRAHEGSGRLDTATGNMQWISPMRPSCHVGVIVAHGHLYWLPWACDCNLQMFGAISLAPAGSFAFAAQATEAERLEKGKAVARSDILRPDARDEWSTYRADNARSAQTPVAVPEQVKLRWQFTPRNEVEPTAPVAGAGMVFVAGLDGVVRALDAHDGQVRWTAYTAGPVRYPPTFALGRVFVGSGDGWVYAFDAGDGGLLWRFRAAPAERRIPIYETLLSTWPVGSGVLFDKSVIYFAAGMNDLDGTHVYALDAISGKIVWQNNTCGHLDAFSRRGVACQGELLTDGARLYLAGGNSVSPGVFDLASGRCLNDPPTSMGTTAIRGRELRLANGAVHVSGQPLYSRPETPVYDKAAQWQDAAILTANARLSWSRPKPEDGGGWTLVAHDRTQGTELWKQPLPGEPVRWGVAVDSAGRVVVSLRNGRILSLDR